MLVFFVFVIWSLTVVGFAFFGQATPDMLHFGPSAVNNVSVPAPLAGYTLYDTEVAACRCCVGASYYAVVIATLGDGYAWALGAWMLSRTPYHWRAWPVIVALSALWFLVRPLFWFVMFYAAYGAIMFSFFLWICPLLCDSTTGPFRSDMCSRTQACASA